MEISVFYENIREAAQQSGRSERRILTDLRERGLKSVYIGYRSLRSGKDRLLPLLKEIGLSVEGLHGFFDLGADPDNDDCPDMIRLAKEAGAGHVLIVPGMIAPEEEPQREIKRNNMCRGLSGAVALGMAEGICVSMENYDGITAPYSRTEDLLWFLDRVPGLMCCFDTGNCIVFHEDELAAYSQLRHRICAVHLKDRSATPINETDRPIQCADGQPAYPAPVGSGYIKIRQLLARMKQDGYEGNLIAELFHYRHTLEGVTQSVDWIRSALRD